MKRLFHIFILPAIFLVLQTDALSAPNTLFLKAQESESKGNLEEAKKIYETLYTSEGKDIYFWKFIHLCEQTRDFHALEGLMLSKLKVSPEHLEARRYLARSYFGQGEFEKAKNILMDIFEDNWKNAGIVKLIASEFINQSEHDKALNVYITARKKMGNSSQFYLEMARLYEFLEMYIPAIEEYLKAPKENSVVSINIEKMLKSAREAGMTDEELTRPFLDRLRNEPGSIIAARIVSDLMYDNGKYEDSYSVLIHPAIETKTPEYIWELAVRLKRDGHKEKAIEIFEDYYRYFTEAPNRVDALLESASIKAELGMKGSANDDYQVLMDDYGGTVYASRAALRLLELLRDKASFEGYTKSLDEFASTTEHREVAYEAYLLLGLTYMRKGLLEEARQAFNNAKIKSRNNSEIYGVCVNSALLYFFKAEYKAMNVEIEICLRSMPDGKDINDLLTYKIIWMRCSSPEDFSGFEEFSRGHYALFREDTDEAIEHFKTVAADLSCIAAPHAACALGKLFKSRQDFSEAMKWYMAAAEAAQDTSVHIGAIIEAADIAEIELKSTERAKELYLEAITRYPGNIYENELRNKLRTMVSK